MKLWADHGNRTYVPLQRAYLAELLIEDENSDAMVQIEEALAVAQETGEHWTDALLHRIRGEILLKQNPADPAIAEARLPRRHRRRATAKRPAASSCAPRFRLPGSISPRAA